MKPHATKPIVVISRDVYGEPIVVLGASRGRNGVRVPTGSELVVELRLFSECPECGSHHRIEAVLSSYLQYCLSIGTEPGIKPEE